MSYDYLPSIAQILFYAFWPILGLVVLAAIVRSILHFFGTRGYTLHYFAENSLFNFFEWELDSGIVHVFGYDRGVQNFYKKQQTHFSEICQILHPDDLEPFREFINSFIAGTQEIGGIEYRVLLPQGTRWVSLQSKVRVKRGKKVLNGYFQDVTDFKRDYLEEKILTGQYQALLEGGDIAFWCWDLPQSKLTVSNTFSQLFGDIDAVDQNNYPASFLIEHIHEEDRTKVHRHLMKIVNGDEGTHECQFRIIRIDGSERWVSCKAVTHLKDNNGHANSLVGMMTDIDEAHRALKKLEEQEVEQRRLADRLQVKIKEAENANKLKSMFLANMSHEIRTPLNAIVGITEALKSSPMSNQQRYYMDIVTHAGDNLLSLVNDILDSSRIEAGELALNRHFFDIRSIVARAMDIVSFRFKSKGLVFSYIVDDDVEHYIDGDEFRIYQVLINLLGNAGKFTDQGEVFLTVKTQPHPYGKELLIKVGDTGRGIPEDSLQSIFEVFSQVRIDSARIVEGTGLGLSIVKKIISLMDGRVFVKSELDRGSVFTVTIPYAKGDWREDHRNYEIVHLKKIAVLNAATHENECIDGQLRRDKVKVDFFNEHGSIDIFQYGCLIIDRSFLNDIVLRQWLQFSMSRHPISCIILCSQHDMLMDDEIMSGLSMVTAINRPFSRIKLIDSIRQGEKDAPVVVPKVEEEHSLIPSVLLVDDSESNLELMRLILRDHVIRIDVARNGREAVHLYSKENYRLVLMDIQMPEMNGHQAYHCIRDIEVDMNKRKTPIWALTAFVHDEEVEQIKQTGFDLYMAKPIKRKEFLRILHHWWQAESS